MSGAGKAGALLVLHPPKFSADLHQHLVIDRSSWKPIRSAKAARLSASAPLGFLVVEAKIAPKSH